MKKLVIGMLMLYIGWFAGTAFGEEVILFGPKQYIRTKGKQNIYTAGFQANSGPAKIFIINGDEERDANRINNATITLNGARIFGPRDLNRHVSDLSADIDLKAENRLKIKLKGRCSGAHPNPHHKKPNPKKSKPFVNWITKLNEKWNFGRHHKPNRPDGPYLTLFVRQARLYRKKLF